MSDKLRVLFLCTGNACRSQMAEGWARHLQGQHLEPYSAGLEPKGVDPRTVEVMAEAGVDISDQRSKSIQEVLSIPFDLVITVCGHADEHCPILPGTTRRLFRGFDDPARAQGSTEDVLGQFRRVRDEIRVFVEQLPGTLGQIGSAD